MGYTVFCDVEACRGEIQSGAGQPALSARERVFCARCSAYVEQVEAQLRVEMTQFAHEGIERLNARRAELMAQMLPQDLGGSGQGFSQWPTVG